MSDVKIKGLGRLISKIEYMEKLGDVKAVVSKSEPGLKRALREEAKFKGHYDSSGKFVKPTGKTRDTIKTEVSKDGLEVKAYPTTDYAKYLEFGTRKMSAQPFVRTGLEKQRARFMTDMRKAFRGGE